MSGQYTAQCDECQSTPRRVCNVTRGRVFVRLRLATAVAPLDDPVVNPAPRTRCGRHLPRTHRTRREIVVDRRLDAPAEIASRKTRRHSVEAAYVHAIIVVRHQ